MKEATGNLNTTMVVVILVAIIFAFASFVVFPSVRSGLHKDADCANAVCEKDKDNDGVVECYLYDEKGNKTGDSFECAYKG